MIPNKERMNTTLPTNTGGGLGFVDKAPAPRPAPAEIMQPSNTNLLSGSAGGLGMTTPMNNFSMNMPVANQPAVIQPAKMGATKSKKRNWLMIGAGIIIPIVGGMVYAKKFDSSDYEQENVEDY